MSGPVFCSLAVTYLKFVPFMKSIKSFLMKSSNLHDHEIVIHYLWIQYCFMLSLDKLNEYNAIHIVYLANNGEQNNVIVIILLLQTLSPFSLCIWHKNVYFSFGLIYMCKKQFETSKSLKSSKKLFFVQNMCVLTLKKVPLYAKTGQFF